MVDTVVRNGRIVSPWSIFNGGVAIQEGKICQVGSDSTLPKGDMTIDAKGRFILPGLIDPHVHLRMPPTYASDLETESGSAACGGVTSMLHYLVEKGSYTSVWDKYHAPIKEKSFIDIGFFAATGSRGHCEEYEELLKRGIISFKFYRAYPEGEADAGGFPIRALDWKTIVYSWDRLRGLGVVPHIHCEDSEIYSLLIPKFTYRRLSDYADSRPPICEEVDVQKACMIAEWLKLPFYICHTTLASSLATVSQYRGRGNTIFVETCPHYLTIDRSGDNLKEQMLAHQTPPYRTKEDVASLWHGISNGFIDCVGTDHCIYKAKEKYDPHNFYSITGYPGLETMLPLLLSEGVNKGRITLEKLVQVTSYNTAKIHNLPQKGLLTPGSDADLVIVDIDEEKEISADKLHSYCDFTIWEGWKAKGWPILTMSRGVVLTEDGQIVGKPGHGLYLRGQPMTRNSYP